MHPKMKLQNISWVNTLFLISTPLIAIIGSVYYFQWNDLSWEMSLLFVGMYIATGMSITGGYHRLFAHKSYQSNAFVRFLFLVFGAAAFQNSAMKWCADHRRHHAKVDTKDDPYNINEGFWYAHILWVFLKANPQYKSSCPDLAKDPLVRWQDKYYIPIAVVIGLLLPALIGYSVGDMWGGLLLGGVLRLVVVHHCTFFINSLCHFWGKQTYTDENSAKDSFLMALFTYGEGYHNFHHKFQADYRNGLKWYHFDPTKWLIGLLAFFGWAKRLVRVPDEELFKAKLRMQHKNFNKKFEALDPYVEEMRLKVEQAQRKWKAVKRDYETLKKEIPEQGRQRLELKKEQMRADVRRAQLEFQFQYEHYLRYSKSLVLQAKARA